MTPLPETNASSRDKRQPVRGEAERQQKRDLHRQHCAATPPLPPEKPKLKPHDVRHLQDLSPALLKFVASAKVTRAGRSYVWGVPFSIALNITTASYTDLNLWYLLWTLSVGSQYRFERRISDILIDWFKKYLFFIKVSIKNWQYDDTFPQGINRKLLAQKLGNALGVAEGKLKIDGPYWNYVIRTI